MRRKKGEQQVALASADGRITPTDVQQVEFRLAFRGYNERDVDAFLDRVTEDLSHYLEENQRLRAGGAPPPLFQAPGADARREAEEILTRAREEAAAIVRRAEQEAAGIRAASSAAGGDARAAVAPFLHTEREFLQSLGSLVQSHAEEVKQMVLALRARSEAAPEPPAPEPPVSQPPEAEPSAEGAASAAEIRARLGEPEPEPAAETDTVVVDAEPAYTEAAPADQGNERSLRELFWGED
jgi:DivIVA domain-containing protein